MNTRVYASLVTRPSGTPRGYLPAIDEFAFKARFTTSPVGDPMRTETIEEVGRYTLASETNDISLEVLDH